MKFLFDWRSPFIVVIEIAGLVWIAVLMGLKGLPFNVNLVPLVIIAVLYLFMRVCAFRKWYNGYPRKAGIGAHFHRGMLPASYFLILLALFITYGLKWGYWIIAALFVVIAHVNVYLLVIYFKDKDKSPPQMYSGGR